MSRFLIIFNAPEPMSSFMGRSTAEQRQAGMDAWSTWATEANRSITFEFGSVTQAVQRIEQKGITESPNQASNYAFAEADSKEVLAKSLQNHPHLLRADATIDVLEILAMPSL